MRVKLDEDLSPIVATPLEERGHEVLTVAAQGWSGTKDDALWPMICGEGVMFITADKGFGDIRKFWNISNSFDHSSRSTISTI